jgi:hypothetical protein
MTDMVLRNDKHICTPQQKGRTPLRARNTSPRSEFGDESTVKVRKPKVTFKGVARARPNRASFLAPTQATAVKQRAKASISISAPSVSVSVSALTVPVSPSFAGSKGTKSGNLTSEDLLMQRLEKEKEEEACRLQKARKLYKTLKAKATRRGSKVFTSRSGSAVKAAKTKARTRFTQPKQIGFVGFGHGSTASLPCHLHGKSGAQGPLESRSTTAAAAPKRGPTGLTLVEPFKFATNKRFAVDAAAHAQAKATAEISGAEQRENFMRDARSHGVSCCHPPCPG